MRQIVVTGGGTGIGRAVAARFAEGGDHVTIVGRREDVLKRAAEETGAIPIVCDLASAEAIQNALPQFPDQVDVLVNNAGGNTDLQGDRPDAAAPPLVATAREWQDNFDANVLTAVLTTAALEDRLREDGRVITIGSIAARTGASSYGAAKAAIEAWSITMAATLGPRGITTNVVAPGLTIDTEFFHGRLTEERYNRLISITPTGRPGTPDDVASVVEFLASPGARHVTSQVLHVNGGSYSGR